MGDEKPTFGTPQIANLNQIINSLINSMFKMHLGCKFHKLYHFFEIIFRFLIQVTTTGIADTNTMPITIYSR